MEMMTAIAMAESFMNKHFISRVIKISDMSVIHKAG